MPTQANAGLLDPVLLLPLLICALIVHIMVSMTYEWDKNKAADNIRNHGIDFADAVIALEDENALTIEDIDHNEQRFKTLGMGSFLNILFVVHIERGNDGIRIISARKADRKEIEQYYKGLNYE